MNPVFADYSSFSQSYSSSESSQKKEKIQVHFSDLPSDALRNILKHCSLSDKQQLVGINKGMKRKMIAQINLIESSERKRFFIGLIEQLNKKNFPREGAKVQDILSKIVPQSFRSLFYLRRYNVGLTRALIAALPSLDMTTLKLLEQGSVAAPMFLKDVFSFLVIERQLSQTHSLNGIERNHALVDISVTFSQLGYIQFAMKCVDHIFSVNDRDDAYVQICGALIERCNDERIIDCCLEIKERISDKEHQNEVLKDICEALIRMNKESRAIQIAEAITVRKLKNDVLWSNSIALARAQKLILAKRTAESISDSTKRESAFYWIASELLTINDRENSFEIAKRYLAGEEQEQIFDMIIQDYIRCNDLEKAQEIASLLHCKSKVRSNVFRNIRALKRQKIS